MSGTIKVKSRALEQHKIKDLALTEKSERQLRENLIGAPAESVGLVVEVNGNEINILIHDDNVLAELTKSKELRCEITALGILEKGIITSIKKVEQVVLVIA